MLANGVKVDGNWTMPDFLRKLRSLFKPLMEWMDEHHTPGTGTYATPHPIVLLTRTSPKASGAKLKAASYSASASIGKTLEQLARKSGSSDWRYRKWYIGELLYLYYICRYECLTLNCLCMA